MGTHSELEHCAIILYVSQTDTNRLENKMSPVIGEHPHTWSHS